MLFEASWALLGLSGGGLEGILTVLENVLGALGPVLRWSWVRLGPSWMSLENSWPPFCRLLDLIFSVLFLFDEFH